MFEALGDVICTALPCPTESVLRAPSLEIVEEQRCSLGGGWGTANMASVSAASTSTLLVSTASQTEDTSSVGGSFAQCTARIFTAHGSGAGGAADVFDMALDAGCEGGGGGGAWAEIGGGAI